MSVAGPEGGFSPRWVPNLEETDSPLGDSQRVTERKLIDNALLFGFEEFTFSALTTVLLSMNPNTIKYTLFSFAVLGDGLSRTLRARKALNKHLRGDIVYSRRNH